MGYETSSIGEGIIMERRIDFRDRLMWLNEGNECSLENVSRVAFRVCRQ